MLAIVRGRERKMRNGTRGCEATCASQKMKPMSNAAEAMNQDNDDDEVQPAVVVLTTP